MKKSILICCLISMSLPLFAKWDTTTSVDKMTDKKSAYATSSYTSSMEPMSFPYSNIKSFIGIGCTETSSWAYIGFSDSPNLVNTKTEDGYSVINTRIKFDNIVKNERLTQDWGSKFIHFYNAEKIIQKIKQSKTLLLELNWYGNSPTYFKYQLDDAERAINSIFNSCGYKPKQEVEKAVKKEPKQQIKKIIKKEKKQEDTIKTEVKTISNEIPLASTTLKERKQECNKKGGGDSWDFKKDIFICVKKKATIKTEVKPISNAEIPLRSNTLTGQKKECIKEGGKYDWDFKKDVFKCIGK